MSSQSALWMVCASFFSPGPVLMRSASGPDNEAVLHGPHEEAFKERIGKTHVAGFRVPPADIWQAKGVNHATVFVPSLNFARVHNAKCD